MRITISDDLADEIASRLPATALPVEEKVTQEAVRLLTKTVGCVGKPFLILDYNDLDRIGMAAGRTIPPMNLPQILDYIDRLGSVRLGEIRLDFPVGQLEEIARLAAREEKDPAEYIARIAASFLSNFFRLPAASVEIPVVTRVVTDAPPVAETAPTA